MNDTQQLKDKIDKIIKQADKVDDLSDYKWDKLGMSTFADAMGTLLIMIDSLKRINLK